MNLLPDAHLPLLFTLFSLGLLALPFVPAWREWRQPTDSAPLPLAPTGELDPQSLAAQARGELAAAKASDWPFDPEAVFQPAPSVASLNAWAQARRPLLARRTLRFTAPVHCPSTLYASASVEAPGGSRFSTVYAGRMLRLGPGGEISRWAHAEEDVTLARGCLALQSISSDRVIVLHEACSFQRLSAPTIRFGSQPPPYRPPAMRARIVGERGRLPGAQRGTETLHRVRGHCRLPAHHGFYGTLIVSGRLEIGAHTTVEGDVKAHQGVILHPGARVTGAIVSAGDIHLMRGASAGGPVIAEANLLLDDGAVAGSPQVPTTVSAHQILVETGARAHGTVWAAQLGVVWSEERAP